MPAPYTPKKRSAWRRFWLEGPGSFVLAIVMALFVRWAVFEAYVIPSGSMLPSLLHHDHIFVNKMVYGVRFPFSERWLAQWSEPERGEVIVFKYPQDKTLYYIKRVVGVPGDRIFYENGNLYINEQLVERAIPTTTKDDDEWLRNTDFPGEVDEGGKENYVHWQETLDGHGYSILLRKAGGRAPTFGPFVVPEGHFFVLGDNRDNSQDSRVWDARSKFSRGEVLITRSSAGAPVTIPKGTIFKTSDTQQLAAQFESTVEVKLTGTEIHVPIQCRDAGAQGNVSAGTIRILPADLSSQGLQADNLSSTKGGEDRRFVPRDYLIGRASLVWLSCEETLPMVRFLCDPLKIRWNRFFHMIR